MQPYQNSLFICSEWYGYHFPELVKIVNDNNSYCKMAKLIGNRKELSEEMLEAMEEITMDSGKAQAILNASRSSMGKSSSLMSLQLGVSLSWMLWCSSNLSIPWIHVMTAYLTELFKRTSLSHFN